MREICEKITEKIVFLNQELVKVKSGQETLKRPLVE